MRELGLIALAAALTAAAAGEPEFTLAPLDNFEDVSAWVKGDPNTDLTQKDAAVAPSTAHVKQGKQSLAFMVHVNWTPRPGEKYGKGWPMISRSFSPAQDWSRYDRLQFWLYTETQSPLPEDRVLRCGVTHGPGGLRDEDWYTLPGIRPNVWQLMAMPLGPGQDWSHVTSLYFYIAEAWYHDGDRVNFYLDDMQLARRNWPVLGAVSASARVFPRGTAVALSVSVEGPVAAARLRCTLSDPRGHKELETELPLDRKRADLRLDAPHLAAGSHWLEVRLIDADDKVRDSRRQFFTSLQPHKQTYLSLITFYTPSILEAKPEQLALLNESAYDAVAIIFGPGYDAGPVPEYEAFRPAMKAIRDTVKIDLWPWVFSNRFIGSPPDAQAHPSSNAKDLDYFRRIKIMDLDNETGARADMMKVWRLAVRAAREWRSPGIVLDLEAYNNYQAYEVSYVAERRGETAPGVIEKCERVGADLARSCEEEYPECLVWSLFSHLDSPHRLPGVEGPVYSTAGHITLGFLKYAKAHHLRCKYLCGGETSPGYYNRNAAALKQKIAERDAAMADLLAEYPDHLFLAGTIAPYHDYQALTWWIREAAGDNPELKTIADFQPMFRALFDAYDWVWIYAASAADTRPYDPANCKLYGDVLRAAKEQAAE